MPSTPTDSTSAVIRVLVVDDQPYVHDAVVTLLKNTPDIRLVGQAYGGMEAIKFCQMSHPDLILMDVVMPGMSGAETTRQLMHLHPRLKILVLSSYSEYEFIKEMLDLGAIGYLVKDAITHDLVNTIRSAAQGNMVLSAKAAKVLLNPSHHSAVSDFGLTERERQVLNLMAKGNTNGQIALELRISEPTVRFHTNNILGKFNVETRSQALVMAAKNQLVE